MTWKVKQVGKIKINNPILIEGLPGMGNVGKIAVDFIIENLNAKKIFEIYSYSSPPSVIINENNLVELPSIEIYHKKVGKSSLLLLTGDIQPFDEESCYEFCEEVLDMFQKYKGKEIITLGGVGLQKIPKRPKIYCTGNTKSIIPKYAIGGVTNELYGVVGPIMGVSGLLLGLAGQRKISAVTLLAETLGHPNHLGIKEAREILKALNSTIKLKLDLGRLDKQIDEIEREMKSKNSEIQKISRKIQKAYAGRDVNYIG